ncbi:hypothetical protein LOK49_LG08G03066 [Camellia lanceoleosa]|uniref:Uncharacterized protein n=1 Tax=Camellia lanceoleosa TaxID=1840588 RepID=A0ACC0GRG0_9ERIC|nr:hypothetical protein LOK49_LG08G03066 [Camellia lanceoleosa]
MLGEVRGHSSRGMASSLVRTGFVRDSMTHGNGCYQHRCINNSLEVVVDGVWKVCPAAATSFTFPSTNPRSKHNLSQQYRVWNRRTFQPSGLFAARVGLQGSTPDELRQQEEEEMDDYCSQVKDHL